MRLHWPFLDRVVESGRNLYYADGNLYYNLYYADGTIVAKTEGQFVDMLKGQCRRAAKYLQAQCDAGGLRDMRIRRRDRDTAISVMHGNDVIADLHIFKRETVEALATRLVGEGATPWVRAVEPQPGAGGRAGEPPSHGAASAEEHVLPYQTQPSIHAAIMHPSIHPSSIQNHQHTKRDR